MREDVSTSVSIFWSPSYDGSTKALSLRPACSQADTSEPLHPLVAADLLRCESVAAGASYLRPGLASFVDSGRSLWFQVQLSKLSILTVRSGAT